MRSWAVPPSTPAGTGCLIKLAGMDLCIAARIDNVFVYPSAVDMDRFNEALGRTLSPWPLVTGRLLTLADNQYAIEMIDTPIPVSLVDNIDLPQWELNENVVINGDGSSLQPFVDDVKVMRLISGCRDEPLLRFKFTRLVLSGEWIMGVSWSHVLSDAASLLQFLNTLSRFYQAMELPLPMPVFERRLWQKDEADGSLVPLIQYLRDAQPSDEAIQIATIGQTTHEQINIHFSGEQLAQLRALSGGTNDDTSSEQTNSTVNHRGVSDAISPSGQVTNAYMMMLSDRFDDPKSLSNIAQTIRRSVVRSRDPKFLEAWVATADLLAREMVANKRLPNMQCSVNEITVNSNYRYDWAASVDLGFTERCRFYTAGTSPLHIRVFRLNPIYRDKKWLGRDRQGAEVAFRIEREFKEKFINAWKQDVENNFVELKE